MPLQQIKLRPGINREMTSYTAEGGWYECDKIRFRNGFPEKIGGWERVSSFTYQGICRALFNWITLDNSVLVSIGTNLKYYIEKGGGYYDVTPIRATVCLTDPFETTNGSPIVVVTDAAGGYEDGDFVTFSGASAVGGITLDGEYQLTLLSATTYSVTAGSAATSDATGGGSVTAAYQINTGPAFSVPVTGWGASTWGSGTWGFGGSTTDLEALRVWSQGNFGEDLVFGPRGGGLYYWDVTSGFSSRGVNVVTMAGASGVPTKQNYIVVSDIYRFVLCFGTNEYLSVTLDPMLIRWSDQESVVDWAPAATSQAGSIRLSNGSEIVTALQTRQEIVVWTDSALYSLQYVGPPDVWTAQLLGDNISIVGQNAKAVASGRVYWMGVDKFYVYDGRVQTLRCDLRRHVFSNINLAQNQQVFAGTNEGFNEVWWFYCSTDSTVVDSYVVYNYLEDVWYYGSLGRTAWIDSGLRDYPQAATYSYNLVSHELGVDDGTTGTLEPIVAYIESAEFDIEDGQNFGFVWRMLPDVTFQGSSAASPQLTMTLYGMNGSGSGFNQTASKGVTRTSTAVIEQFTNIIYTRIRGRQMIMKAQSDGLGVTWQLGAPRIDVNIDGQR